MNRITIVGCGLIGSSLALALRRVHAFDVIAGWDTDEATLRDVVARGIVDEIDQSFHSNQVSDSDVVSLAMPVGAIIEFLRLRSHLVKPGAILTDVGSTKASICRAAREHLAPGRLFVGGHPIAGSHLGGHQHAHADLFLGAPYILVSDSDPMCASALRRVEAMARSLGSRVELMTAEEHDRRMAFVSHLPQILSSALAATARGAMNHADQFAGDGYRDMTRLAGSPWQIWGDIIRTNRTELSVALGEFIQNLNRVADELGNDSDSLDQTREFFNHEPA